MVINNLRFMIDRKLIRGHFASSKDLLRSFVNWGASFYSSPRNGGFDPTSVSLRLG